MGEQGGCTMLKSEGSSEGSSEASIVPQTFASDIHILLVDHHKELLISTSRMLELCSYKVTIVELVSIALSMLSKGKGTFDLVMANVDSLDNMYGYQLLKEADCLCVPVILLSSNSNPDIARNAIERGAILFLEIPTTQNVLRYIWQLVLSDKRRRTIQLTLEGKGNGNKRKLAIEEVNTICIDDDDNDDEVQILDSSNYNELIKKKECTQWTTELHAKFLDAVNQLGEGRCYPREIVQVMNVPGLSKMQVSSHLQKYRNNTWKISKKQNSNTTSSNGPGPSNSLDNSDPHRHHQSEKKLKIYGRSMPQLPTENNQEPLATQEENPYDEKAEVSQWQIQYHPLNAPTQWYNNGNNIFGGNIEENGLASDHYGMPNNICTSGNNYLAPSGSSSSMVAPLENPLLQIYQSFCSEVSYGMLDYNLIQSPVPSASQCLNLHGLDLENPYVEGGMPSRSNNEDNDNPNGYPEIRTQTMRKPS